MLGIPNGSRLDNALKINRGTVAVHNANRLQSAQKSAAEGSVAKGKPTVVRGIDYKTGKRRVLRIKSKALQKALRIEPSAEDVAAKATATKVLVDTKGGQAKGGQVKVGLVKGGLVKVGLAKAAKGTPDAKPRT